MTNTIIQSSGIALISNGKIFLIKPFQSNNEKWGIPKGHIEGNENIQKTAIREFTEETGIKIVGALEYFTTVSTRYNNTIKNVDIYKCISQGSEVFVKSNLITEGKMAGNPENVAGQWFTYNEALEKIHKYQIPIIKKLKDEDRLFKSFYDNRESTLASNELLFNSTISILMYDSRMNPRQHLYLMQKYLNISDKVVLFIIEDYYKTFNIELLAFYKDNIPSNIEVVIISNKMPYIRDIIDYVDKNIKHVNIILGSNKKQKMYQSLYELYEYLDSKSGINVLDPKKYAM
jgi:predicted NUDIX family NTP pyrophosphohydrolase